MKRLAVVLAASLLGTGCIVSDDSGLGTVNLYWDFARHAPAQQGGFLFYDEDLSGTGDQSCDQSAVESVRVVPPVGGAVDVTCVFGGVQGITFFDMPDGAQPFRVTGYRGGITVFDSSVTVSVRSDAVTDAVIDVVGVSAPLDLFGDLATGVPPAEQFYLTCAEASNPDITFEINDVFGSAIDSGTVGCTDPLPAPVFSSSLDLDDYKVHMQGNRRSDGALLFDSCWVDLAHFSSQTGTNGFAATLLTNPVPVCSDPF